jgi:hypothetical protein
MYKLGFFRRNDLVLVDDMSTVLTVPCDLYAVVDEGGRLVRRRDVESPALYLSERKEVIEGVIGVLSRR